MLRKLFLAPAILSLACVLLTTDVAQAQRRGGGGGGGGGGRGRGSIGVYVGPGGVSVGSGGYYRSGYYGSGYYSPYWYDSYYSYPRTSYYYAPPVQYVEPAPVQVVDDRAQIRVIVADPQARVWFDDRLTTQQGTDRLFSTPALTVSGTYRIRAAWMQGGAEAMAERTVTVAPGQTIVVDFTRR
ncbi:MAG: TIGR03000 domain-containing protein [Planctomycetes bacterium]|nr:TIGR03000 domain-containing protein [Planctomycetota bacterium]